MRFKLINLFLIVSFSLLTQVTTANVWLFPKDELLVKKLEYLSHSTFSSIDTTTYPISISNAEEDSHPEIFDLININFTYDNKFSIDYSNEINPFREIYDDSKDKKSVSVEKQFNFDKSYIPEFDAKINLTKNFSPSLQKKISLDGTYFSIVWPNVVLGAGFVERWWGPGHDNSLILSNYSYAQPGLYLKSMSPLKFNNFLSFIGKINYAFFFNRLENNRFIKNTNLIGTRITLQPTNNLTLGFSRVTMFGGKDRPDSFEDFLNNFFRLTRSKDELDLSNELAGYDLKYNFKFRDLLFSSYFQLIGEDEIRFTPSTKIITVGNEIIFLKNGLLRSFGIEYSNTIGDFGDRYGVAYEHSTYNSGYRYKKLPLGAFIDNDSTFLKFTSNFELTEAVSVNFSIFKGRFNKDKIGTNNIWGIDNLEDYEGLKFKFFYSFEKNFSLENEILVLNDELFFNSQALEKVTLNLKLNYNF